jgi:hypothetical protein
LAPIRQHIQRMSALSARLNIMLEQALRVVKSDEERNELCAVACAVSNGSWRFWQAWRPPEDNRQEHEWVVFANIIRIAESEGLNLSDKRVAIAFAFTHDSLFIPRIMEASILAIEEEADRMASRDSRRAAELRLEAAQLREEKKLQRARHMDGGARNAGFLLNQLTHPDHPGEPLLTPTEIDRCVEIVKMHDLWKVGTPHPPGSDKLAVACLEADALWPLHPYGVLADLERPDAQGATRDSSDPEEWRRKLEESLRALLVYRANWHDVSGETFVDDESIFRTDEGHRLYTAWRRFWSLQESAGFLAGSV